MRFLLFKFHKNKTPAPASLRPPIFRVEVFWYAALALYALLIVIFMIVGLRLFYFGYFKGYRGEISSAEFENLIDTKALNSAIEKRHQFINSASTLPSDPSQ